MAALNQEQIAILLTLAGERQVLKGLSDVEKAEKKVLDQRKKQTAATAKTIKQGQQYANQQKLLSALATSGRARQAIAGKKMPSKAPFTTPMGLMMPPGRTTMGGGGASPFNPIPTIGKMNKFPQPEPFKDIEWSRYGNPKYNVPKALPKGQTRNQELIGKMNNGLKKTNMGLFKMQMASLGVYFSFMSIGMAITGLFAGLQDLGGAFKSMALGKAFGGVDILGGMGVEPGQLVEGWKNITGIMGMMQTLMTGIAAVALSPEVMKAIQDMFTELSKALSDGKVAKALGDIIIAFTEMMTDCIIPILPLLADVISALGDSGLLKYIILLVLGAQYLLAGLSMLGFAFQAVGIIMGLLTPVITLVSSVMAALGVGFGGLIAIVLAALFVVDLFINIWENFQQTGLTFATFWNALYDTFADFYNVLLPIINLIGGFVGRGNFEAVETNSGRASTVNNYNFNGNYDDPSALINQTKKSQSRAF